MMQDLARKLIVIFFRSLHQPDTCDVVSIFGPLDTLEAKAAGMKHFFILLQQVFLVGANDFIGMRLVDPVDHMLQFGEQEEGCQDDAR